MAKGIYPGELGTDKEVGGHFYLASMALWEGDIVLSGQIGLNYKLIARGVWGIGIHIHIHLCFHDEL